MWRRGAQLGVSRDFPWSIASPKLFPLPLLVQCHMHEADNLILLIVFMLDTKQAKTGVDVSEVELFWHHEKASGTASCLRMALLHKSSRLSVANRLCVLYLCFGLTARVWTVVCSWESIFGGDALQRRRYVKQQPSYLMLRPPVRTAMTQFLTEKPLDDSLDVVDAMLSGTAWPPLREQFTSTKVSR